MFAERDPVGYLESGNPFQIEAYNPVNMSDPSGDWFILNLAMLGRSGKRAGQPWVVSTVHTNDGARIGKPMVGRAEGNGSTWSLFVWDAASGSEKSLRFLGITTPPAHGTRARRALRRGDTPFGVYLTGDRGLGVYQVAQTPADAVRVLGSTKKARAFGLAKINLHPILMEGGAERNRRDLIRMHGGGSKLRNPFALRQRRRPTWGCLRFCNADLLAIVDYIREGQQRDRHTNGLALIGDRDFLVALAGSQRLKRRWRRYGVYGATGLHYVDLVRFILLNYKYRTEPSEY